MSCEYVDEIPGNPYKRAPLTITHRSDKAKALKRLQKERVQFHIHFFFHGQKMQHIINRYMVGMPLRAKIPQKR